MTKIWKDFAQHIIVVIWMLVGLANGVPMDPIGTELPMDIQPDDQYKFVVPVAGDNQVQVTIKKASSLYSKLKGKRQILVSEFRLTNPLNVKTLRIPVVYKVTTRGFRSQNAETQRKLNEVMQYEYEVLEHLHKLFPYPDKIEQSQMKHVVRVFKVFPPEEGDLTGKKLTFITESGGHRLDEWDESHGKILRPNHLIWIVDVILQMAKGVQVLHNERIVHGDLKLESFFVLEQQHEVVKIDNFDYSIRLEGKTTVYYDKMELKSLAYVAPETLAHDTAVINNNMNELYSRDIWSMGVSMFRLLSGNFPFSIPHEAETQNTRPSNSVISESIKSQRSELGDDTLKKKYEVPEELSSIVFECLNLEWDKRPTIGQLVEKLEKYYKANNKLSHS